MKRNKFTMAIVVLLCSCLMFSSCIGSFGLTSKLHNWNKGVGGNKFVSELVFLAFCILPAYELSVFADVIIFNSIEFWSGSNPIAENTQHLKGENGHDFLVKTHQNGYYISFWLRSWLCLLWPMTCRCLPSANARASRTTRSASCGRPRWGWSSASRRVSPSGGQPRCPYP